MLFGYRVTKRVECTQVTYRLMRFCFGRHLDASVRHTEWQISKFRRECDSFSS